METHVREHGKKSSASMATEQHIHCHRFHCYRAYVQLEASAASMTAWRVFLGNMIVAPCGFISDHTEENSDAQLSRIHEQRTATEPAVLIL